MGYRGTHTFHISVLHIKIILNYYEAWISKLPRQIANNNIDLISL